VKNSRTESNSRTWLLNAPVDDGLAASRIDSACSNSLD